MMRFWSWVTEGRLGMGKSGPRMWVLSVYQQRISDYERRDWSVLKHHSCTQELMKTHFVLGESEHMHMLCLRNPSVFLFSWKSQLDPSWFRKEHSCLSLSKPCLLREFPNKGKVLQLLPGSCPCLSSHLKCSLNFWPYLGTNPACGWHVFMTHLQPIKSPRFCLILFCGFGYSILDVWAWRIHLGVGLLK